jgi:hypothetical protein
MPTFDTRGTQTPQQGQGQPANIAISGPLYKGVTVDTTLTPVAQLLTHVEGSSWTVNYYSQVLDADSQVTGQALGQYAVTQQYKLIRGMELKVTTPLSAVVDNEQKTTSYTGTATVYPFVRPNQGDMFLADVGAGREGIFEITTVTPLSIYKQTCHTIDYRMIDFSDVGTRRQDLENKTVETLQYVRDFLTYGQNPLVFEEDFTQLQQLRRNFKLMVKQYFDSFFSQEYGTIILPGQTLPTYDPYLVKALLTCFTMDDNPKVMNVRCLNVEDDQAFQATTLWTALIEREKKYLLDAFTQYGLVYAYEFSGNAMHEGIRYSGMARVVYPLDPVLTVDYNQQPPTKLVSGETLEIAPPKMTPAARMNPNVQWLDNSLPDVLTGFASGQGLADAPQLPPPPPYIHNAMMDGYYVFSQAFYNNDCTPGAQSQLELLVRQYLDGKALNYRALAELSDSVSRGGLWTSMSRFYYVPILLILIRSAVRSF